MIQSLLSFLFLSENKKREIFCLAFFVNQLRSIVSKPISDLPFFHH